MIKIGDKVKIVSLHERDAYFKDGIPGSKGIVRSIEDKAWNRDGINYYAGYIHITDPSDTMNPMFGGEDDLLVPFYFAYAQLRKVRK